MLQFEIKKRSLWKINQFMRFSLYLILGILLGTNSPNTGIDFALIAE
jgi:hypothetical protein